MRIYIRIVFISLIITSCFKPYANRQYFKYDEVDHYYLEEVYEKKLKLINNQTLKTREEKQMLDFYEGIYEYQFSDSISLLSIMDSIHYTKQKILKNDISKLKKIFRDRKIDNRYDNMCFREYRDILVFKYNNSITGIAFICFKCNQNEIIGTKVNTFDFGEKGNYEKLRRILYNK